MNKFLKKLKIDKKIIDNYKLPCQIECKELVFYGYNPYKKIIFVNLPTFKAWYAMQEAAKKDQIDLEIFSGFRSFKQQAQIIKAKLEVPIDLTEILKISALPGYSEHHSGFALDLYQPSKKSYINNDFEQSEAYAWLCIHAEHFGFKLSYPRDNPFNINFEPWHWCFHP